MQKTSPRIPDRVILAVILICAILVVALPSGMLLERYLDARFTPEKWAENPYRRLEIVDDLLKKHPLAGMSEAEITALLGEENYPDSPTLDGENVPAESVLVYHLGADYVNEVRLVIRLRDGVAVGIGYLYDEEYVTERR